MAKALEAEIDKLFQLPPDQFTAARNALAKGAGSQAAAIKALTRPPVAAWAVNQLYWQDGERYNALVAAANEMRKTHRAVIEGRKGDLREAGREHEGALDAALKSAVALMKQAGQPVTDATRHAILNTLRALPADEAPGRLTQVLSPGGFEMLAGVTPAKVKPRKAPTQPAAAGRTETRADRESARKLAEERERQAAAERAVRAADQRARQAEFENARASREAAKTERRLEEARAALEAAQEEFDTATKEAAAATKARDQAEKRLEEATAALDKAKERT